MMDTCFVARDARLASLSRSELSALMEYVTQCATLARQQRSKEDQEGERANRSVARKNRWGRLSREERKEATKQLSDGNKAMWAAMSPEERRACTASIRDTGASINKHRSDAMKRYWESMPQSERERLGVVWSDARKTHWANLPTDERARRRRLLSDGNAAMWAAMSAEERLRFVKANQRQSPTGIERAIAAILDALAIAYVPQYQIGRYIVDFFVPGKLLVIEADGTYWHSRPDVRAKDDKKDAYLRLSGYTILRIAETAIKAGKFDTLRQAVS